MTGKASALELGKSDEMRTSDNSSAVAVVKRLILALSSFKANAESLGAMLGNLISFSFPNFPLPRGDKEDSSVSRIVCAAIRRSSACSSDTGSSGA